MMLGEFPRMPKAHTPDDCMDAIAESPLYRRTSPHSSASGSNNPIDQSCLHRPEFDLQLGTGAFPHAAMLS